MREIKFRFWHLAEKKMIDWFWITQNAWNSFRGDQPISLLFDFLTVKKDQVVIQQFTGLQDCDEKDAYESDIIQDETGNIYIITWSDECYSGKWGWEALSVDGSNEQYFYGGIDFEFKIIGNIHENPELLKDV